MGGSAEHSGARGRPRDELARILSLGGVHALRNAMQVVRSYTESQMPEGPGREAVRVGVDQVLQLAASLEGILGQAPGPPAPDEVLASFRLLPKFFVHELRRKRQACDLSGVGRPDPALLEWDLLRLAALWLGELIELVPPGEGRIGLVLAGVELRLAWEPPAGTLPFPLVQEGEEVPGHEIGRRLGLVLQVLPSRYGYRAVVAGGKEDRP